MTAPNKVRTVRPVVYELICSDPNPLTAYAIHQLIDSLDKMQPFTDWPPAHVFGARWEKIHTVLGELLTAGTVIRQAGKPDTFTKALTQPAVYSADTDEMTTGQLAVLAEARQRLTVRYAGQRALAEEISAVLDAYAVQLLAVLEGDDEDDQEDEVSP